MLKDFQYLSEILPVSRKLCYFIIFFFIYLLFLRKLKDGDFSICQEELLRYQNKLSVRENQNSNVSVGAVMLIIIGKMETLKTSMCVKIDTVGVVTYWYRMSKINIVLISWHIRWLPWIWWHWTLLVVKDQYANLVYLNICTKYTCRKFELDIGHRSCKRVMEEKNTLVLQICVPLDLM